jgi:clan AA aspartic protease
MLLRPRRLKGERRMGITTVGVTLANAQNDRRRIDTDMVVDSGAIYSVVPATILRRIGVEPRRTETFWLADGRSIRRKMGEVRFEIQGREGVSKVIFGRAGDSPLLGMITLETLGLSLDPLKRTLHPLKLMIA